MKAVKIKSRLFLGLVEARADLTSAKFLYYYGYVKKTSYLIDQRF